MTAVLLRAVAVVSAVLAIVGVGLAPGAGPKPEPTVVSVRLSETGITLSQTSVPAGRVLFSVQNRSSTGGDSRSWERPAPGYSVRAGRPRSW